MSREEPNVRLRRSKSLNEADDLRKCEQVVRKLQPDKPCHKFQDSLFSWTSGFSDFSGFVDWAFVLLLMGGIRLLLENLLKYGIRIDPKSWLLLLCGGSAREHYTAIIMLSYSIVPICVTLFTEKALSKKIFAESVGLGIELVNLTLIILLPMVIITHYDEQFSLIGASVVCFTYSILFLKMWSYIQVNMWCRKRFHEQMHQKLKQSVSVASSLSNEEHKDDHVDNVEAHLVMYPNNLNIKDIAYFMAIPTLCYELNFPRTDRIRKRFIIRRILELVIGVHVMAAVVQQWIIPSVKHALIPFTNMDVIKSTERMLKLSIPNHLLWLIMFYLVFHSFLNFTGEIFHFADRNFYLDWWNATNTNVFWRKWNTIVHQWAVRHVYLPMVEVGYGKSAASCTVFFISAFFHEFLVSVPLRTFRSWAFVGMMMQVPLASLSSYVENRYGPRWGNIIVWLSLILGQPLCIMMYYHDYVISHYGEALLEQFGNVR